MVMRQNPVGLALLTTLHSSVWSLQESALEYGVSPKSFPFSDVAHIGPNDKILRLLLHLLSVQMLNEKIKNIIIPMC